MLTDKVKTETDDEAGTERVVLGFKLRFKEPTEIEQHREITYWHYNIPFGDRVIRYTIKFKDRRVTDWYAKPIPKEF